MDGASVRGGDQVIPRPAEWEPGDPPVWADAVAERPSLQLDHVREVLARGPAPAPSPHEDGGNPTSPSPSAVLVPLYEHDDELWIVMTRRSWAMRSHTGEVSFPGGRREPADDHLWQTATREAWEEVDLDPASPERIGELDHLATVTSRSFIVPYVAALPGRPELTANPDEVDAILHVRVAELLAAEVYRQEVWRWDGMSRPIHFFEIVGDTIWGATGSMLVDFLGRITAS